MKKDHTTGAIHLEIHFLRYKIIGGLTLAASPYLGLELTILVIKIQIRLVRPVLGIRNRILRIRMFLGLPDPDPLVRGMDPDPASDPTLFS